MSRKSKYPYEIKLKAVKAYNEKKANYNELSRQTGATVRGIKEWISQYRSMGEEGLLDTHKNKRYPSYVKEASVREYLTGRYTLLEICEKYEIRSNKQLRDWINKYNGHETIKGNKSGGAIVTKGRKTTYEERVEIVTACIEQGHNYNLIAQTYQVSYQQVYSWTAKYEQSGIEALSDRRGKRKPEIEMSELDKLKVQNKLLEAKNRRQSLEIEFLKKMKELGGGGA